MRPSPSLPLYGDRHFVRFLFPFALKETMQPLGARFWRRLFRRRDALARIDKKLRRMGQWQPLRGANPEYILPHVEDFLLPDANTPRKARYVFSYMLNDDHLQRCLRKGGKCRLIVRRRTEERRYPMEVQRVHLFLFRSGVGVLVLDVQPKQRIERVRHAAKEGTESQVETLPLDLEQIIQFNLAFRRVQSSGSSAVIRLPERKGDKERDGNNSGDKKVKKESTLLLASWIDELLSPIGREGEAWEAFYDRRLVGFTFALVARQGNDGKPVPIPYDDLKEPLYWLRRYLEPGYLPAEADLVLEDNPEVLQTFGNIYFGLSMEGGAVVAWDSGVSFIRDTLHARVKEGYFLVFLLALHQRLATIHLARVVGTSSYVRYGQNPSRRKVVREVQHVRRRIFEFIIRCWFAEVSNMKMYTEVYRRCQQVFQVNELLAEVKNEIEELDDYLQRVQMERESRIINFLTWFFMPLILILGFWGMNFIELTRPGFSILDLTVWKWTAVPIAAYYLFLLLLRLVYRLGER